MDNSSARPMKYALAVLMIAVGAYSAAGAHDTTTPEQELVSEIGKADLKAGITFEQANAIAQFYFQHYVSGCGGADPAVDRGSRWEVTPRLGIAGIPSKTPIVIEKYTGTISRKNGPTLSLAAILAPKEVLPQPIHKVAVTWPKHLPSDGHSVTIQIEFVVSLSGATSDFRLMHSSGRFECDRAVRGAVEGWRYAPRKEPITLVESIETCTY
ncbi:TonB family protein [Dyella sp. S184]|uniref:energy transducer TonB n=1 Tax=Dyella sp. S184 TaxID=1641862 RepID=UPI00131E4A4F|nr:TonB family protein [Dyella sp. S184]